MAWGTGLVMSGVDRLAAGWLSVQPGDYDPSSGHGPEWGKAAPAGLLIWLFLGAALFFLIKSMNRHMKRVPKAFGAEPAGSGAAAPESAVADAEEQADVTVSPAAPDPAATPE